MSLRTVIALVLALASTTLTNIAYLREHDAAAALPVLSMRRPFQSLQLLLSDRSWLLGFAMESSGFLLYEGGRKTGVDETAYRVLGIVKGTGPGDPAILERLTLAMLNESARALEEGVVRQPRDGDIGAVFGIGYPPFRGGPFRTLDALGAAHVVQSLERLATRFGPRFAPAAILVDQAKRGGRFYPAT